MTGIIQYSSFDQICVYVCECVQRLAVGNSCWEQFATHFKHSVFLTRFIQWNYCVYIVFCIVFNTQKRLVHSTTLFRCICDVFMDLLHNFSRPAQLKLHTRKKNGRTHRKQRLMLSICFCVCVSSWFFVPTVAILLRPPNGKRLMCSGNADWC